MTQKTNNSETLETLETPVERYKGINSVNNNENNNSISFFIDIYQYTPVSSYSSVSFNNIFNNITNIGIETLETLKISKEELKKILFFNAGRLDYYWEYSRKGKPFFKREQSNESEKGKVISLSFEDLLKHFLGILTLGFSPFIDSESIMFGAIDFDAHTSTELSDNENNKLIEEAQKDSLHVYEFLKELNLPVVLNSSGSKGRHVRLCCPGAKAKDIRIFLKYVLEKVCGDSNKHEVFPKQDNLTPERPRGNQLKGLLGIHRKTGLRANILFEGVLLDLHDSTKHICELVDKLDTFSPIIIQQEDYSRFEKEEDKRITLEKINNPNINYSSEGDVPVYCSFLENIASKKTLPSGGGYNRHFYLDPNIESYGIKHLTIRNNYALKQGRDSNTAFDNWKKYSNNIPVFKCSQIISYLKYHAKKNLDCLNGLKECINCPQFKSFIENKNSPKGYARSLIISEIAKSNDLLNCLKCNKEFIFNDQRGFFYCKNCKMGGGITMFAKLLVIKQKRKNEEEREKNEEK